ncbi:hypothetical protein GCM10009760_50180 [Kitasatospora kazusensis]|uniref:DUF397 domain-containing protein n=1 Tax=Kitasatospora kazusensis TaxID=407974 RepID=A0ABP5LXD1_9ACTN
MSTACTPDLHAAEWFKSTYSDAQGQGDCVRVATNFASTHGAVLVGDTKAPGVHFSVSSEAWSAFVAATVRGEFGAV